ncbi:solute carrier family 15 member 1-like [Daktulosphaira vitifoliae]|uniref:solute carrier family 15 member 1-like n=1 Tax=Daktulosphaira vitifoliae TaxID=58002 RepID=UPI0021AAFFCC|nr:solute carrier family 15 member 1-like [Daktulosphaira vitifoliae]
MYDEKQSISIFHMFMMLCFVSAMSGGIIGNSEYGKYKTILAFTITNWLGVFLLFYSTLQTQDTTIRTFISFYGLILISIGVGGMKPCVPAFSLDQLFVNDRNINVSIAEHFFSTFYFVIHVAVLFGTITSPALTIFILRIHKTVLNSNRDSYTFRFGLSNILMTVGIGAFLCGNPYYLLKKSNESILLKMIKCIVIASWKKLKHGLRRSNQIHWLDYSKSVSPLNVIHDAKKLLHMFRLYIPLSMFWSLFDQQNTTWLFQAARTNGRFFGIEIPVYTLQIVSPVLVLITIPFMNRIVYPYLDGHKLFKYPLKRILLGGGVASLAFVLSGFVELNLENNLKNTLRSDVSNVYIVNMLPCSVKIWISNSSVEKINENQYFFKRNVFLIPENIVYVGISVDDGCDKIITRQKYKIRLQINTTKLIILSLETKNYSLKITTQILSNNLINNYRKNNSPLLYSTILLDDTFDHWTDIKNSTFFNLQSSIKHLYFLKTTTDDSMHLIKTNVVQVNPGKYTFTINNYNKNLYRTRSNVFKLEKKENYVYIGLWNSKVIYKSQLISLYRPRGISLQWLLPQFICMAIGETLFTLTGLAFTFSEAPESMKTVSLSMWYLSVALGNLIVIFFNHTILFDNKSTEFFMFSIITIIVIIILYRMSNTFEKIYNENRLDIPIDLVMTIQRSSYQLAF